MPLPVQTATNIPPATAVNMNWTRAKKRQIRELFGLVGTNKRITKAFARVRGFESLESLRLTSWGIIQGEAATLARMTLVTGLDLDQRASAMAADADLRERVQQRVRESMDRLPERVDVTAMTERRLMHAGGNGTRYVATVKATLDITMKSSNGKEIVYTDMVRRAPGRIVGDEGELQEQAEALVEEIKEIEMNKSQVIDVKVTDWVLEEVAENVTGEQQRNFTSVRMRSASFMRIDGVVPNGYDTGRGQCVVDVIKALFSDPKYRMVKLLKDEAKIWGSFTKAYHEIAKGEWDYKPNYNPKKDGVSPDVFQVGFCEPNHISHYVCDMSGTVVKRWVDPANRSYHRPVVVYRVFNNHMFLELESARKIANATSGAAHHYVARSLLSAEHGAQSKGDDKATAFDPTSIVEVEGEQDGLPHMAAYASEHGVWPSGSNIHIYDDKVVKYKVDGVQYVFGQQLSLVAEAYDRMGWERRGGETATGLLWRTVDEVYGRPGMVRGRPNPEAREVLLSEGIKGIAQCGKLMERLPAGKYEVFDRSKSHAAALHSPLEHWYVPGPHDHVERFPRPLKDCPTRAGLYYVTAPANSALFRRGTSWYTRLAVQEAHRTGVDFSYSAFLPCSVHMPVDYFRPLVEKLVEVAGGNPELYKTLVCHLSGYMGKDIMRRTVSFIDNNTDTMWAHTHRFLAEGFEPGLVQSTGVDGHSLFYFHAITQLTELNTTVYLSILDNQSVALHRLERSVGGHVVMRKSDCTVIARGKRSPAPIPRLVPSATLPANCRAEIAKWGQFKREERVPRITSLMADAGVELPDARPWVHRGAIRDSAQYMDVVTLVVQKGRCLITGAPGTGKSWTAMKVAAVLEEEHGLRVLKVCYTNVGALNIGGQTIDRGLGLKKKEDDGSPEVCHFGKKWLKDLASSYDVLLVNEISLVPESHWVAVDALLTYKPNMKVVLVGDKHQCSPVEVTSSDAHRRKWPHYFDHSIVMHAAGFNLVELTARHRSTDPLLNETMDVLKVTGDAPRARFGQGTGYERNICYTNDMRKRINAQKNKELAPADAFYLPTWTDTRPKPIDDQPSMLLYPGLPLQCQETLRNPSWVTEKAKPKKVKGKKAPYFANNERFEVTKVGRCAVELQGVRKGVTTEGSEVIISEEARKVTCPLKQLQRYFRLGFATTVHSSQGTTITEPFTIWEWERMSPQLRYTAVGRAKRLEQVHLAPPQPRFQEEMDQENMEGRVVLDKLRKYKRQDMDAGRYHPWSAYPSKADVMASLQAADYKCEHCQCSMRVVHKAGDLAQWTLQRKDNSRGHVVGNVVNYCLECNKRAPEQSHTAAPDSDSEDD